MTDQHCICPTRVRDNSIIWDLIQWVACPIHNPDYKEDENDDGTI